MNTKYRSLITAFILFLPFIASAQPQQPVNLPSFAENLAVTLLPIFLLGLFFLFIWFFFIRYVRKLRERSAQHHEKVEQLLERIAKAVEDKNKNPS